MMYPKKWPEIRDTTDVSSFVLFKKEHFDCNLETRYFKQQKNSDSIFKVGARNMLL